ncbi:MarR family winged helix-turn-helix transcriptional regulator [Lachnospiraceae bacterium 50-23]|jgi:DNA-binding MarR family transcriptional regulator|nr:winged helix-turn-helix transcriptional regulator [Dorea sp.]
MYKSDKSICYCTNIRRISNAITNYYDNALKETGLSVPQYDLLLTLSRLEKANTTQWAKHVGLERTTMVRNAQLLQSRGFIERTEGPGKTYTLSKKGLKALEKASMLWVRTQMKIKSFLGKEDVAAIMRIESKIQNLPSD